MGEVRHVHVEFIPPQPRPGYSDAPAKLAFDVVLENGISGRVSFFESGTLPDVSINDKGHSAAVAALPVAILEHIAEVLPDVTLALARERARREAAQEAAASAVRARIRAEGRLEAVLTGRAFLGEALLVTKPDGSCWLQDPVKRDRGMGLHFESLAAVWREFPQLRPVRWDGGDLIVAPFGVEAVL